MCGYFIGVLWHSIIINKGESKARSSPLHGFGEIHRQETGHYMPKNIWKRKNIKLTRRCMRVRKIANQKDRTSIFVTTLKTTKWPAAVPIRKLVDQRVASWPGCVSKFKVSTSPVIRWCCVQFEKPAYVSLRVRLLLGSKLLKFWCESSADFYKSFLSCHGCWCWAWESLNRRRRNSFTF